MPMTKALILTPTVDMMKTATVGCANVSQVHVLSRPHDTCVVVSILSQEIPVDWTYKKCLMWTRILHLLPSFSSSSWKWSSYKWQRLINAVSILRHTWQWQQTQCPWLYRRHIFLAIKIQMGLDIEAHWKVTGQL